MSVGRALVRAGWWLCLLVGVPALPALARQADATPTPARVVVSGKQTDTDARREFVAGKIIIGRQRIEESGAENVAELLKREPSVSVAADGRVGLLGLPGYTQVLVDGAPPDAGKGLHQLNLVHVEKIEIVKSAIAEYGPFGIAGTINIITRKTARKTSTELGLSASAAGGEPGAGFTLAHNQSRAGSPLRASVNLSADHSRAAGESRQGLSTRLPGQAAQAVWEGASHSRRRAQYASLSAELAWDAGTAHGWRLSPNGGQSASRDAAAEERSYAGGQDTRTGIAARSVVRMAHLPFAWTYKPDKRSQLEMRARVSSLGLERTEDRQDSAGQSPVLRQSYQDAGSRVRQLELSYKARLAKGHDVKLGASSLRIRETIDYRNRIDARPDPAFDFLGAERQGWSHQARLYAQDDWRVSESLALNAGLSGQHTGLGVDEGGYASRSRLRLWSPSLHLLKDIGGDDTRQLRMSLARTYRAPDRGDLALRPGINPLAPCGIGACGANTIDTLDSAGNPALQPERSLGLNLAYEHGIGDNSTLTAEVYVRRIDGKIGTGIALEAVPWADAPRYVSRPANLGDARVLGLNLEMDLALRDWSRSAPRINLRGNVNLTASTVSGLPGRTTGSTSRHRGAPSWAGTMPLPAGL